MNCLKITVGDLKKALMDLPDDMPLIYSHDDEGNEIQGVVFEPHVTYVARSYSHRFLETLDEEDDPELLKDAVKCLCIN
jgi:hypothetical protein